eukprot:IDg14767t1
MVSFSALVRAAEDGAKSSASKQSDAMASYTLGVAAARSSTMKPRAKLKIRLPGNGDVVTAACFMLGGTADVEMASVLMRVSPTEPHDQRISAIDELLGRRIRSEVFVCNDDSEMKGSGRICLRIFDVIVDIVLAFGTQKLLEHIFKLQQREIELQHRMAVASAAALTLRQRFKLVVASSNAKDATIRTLQAQLEVEQKEHDCIRKLIPDEQMGDELTDNSPNVQSATKVENMALTGGPPNQSWIHSVLFSNAIDVVLKRHSLPTTVQYSTVAFC